MKKHLQDIVDRQQLSDIAVFDDRPLTEDFDLRDLRHQNPFWSIVPWPNSVVAVNFTDTNPVDITLPQGTKVVRFRKQEGKDILVNIKGAAQPIVGIEDFGASSMVNPTDDWYYVGSGILTVSVACMATPCVMSIECFVQL